MAQQNKIFKIYQKFVQKFGKYFPENSKIIGITHNFFIRKLMLKQIVKNGFLLTLDQNDSLRLSKSLTDNSFTTKIMKQNIKKNQTVLDIGAHIGYYSLIFARQVGTGGKVFAFEPEKENYSLLLQNISNNKFKNILPLRLGVSDKNGKKRLYLSQDSQADHRFSKTFPKRNYEVVEVVKIDNYFKKTEFKFDFIKIDVQGYEIKVVKGMEKIINRSKKIKLLVEFWPKGLQQAGFDPIELIRLITNLGFKLHDINEWQRKIETITAEKLNKKYTIINNKDTNLLCVRE